MNQAATTTAPVERALRADARRNRERILVGAREVFAESGVDAQMDDIAARAGVGVGTVYRHFPTKEALIAELVRHKFRLFAEAAREAVERSDDDPFEALAGVLRRNGEVCARDAGMQHALAGFGERIWRQARAEQDELTALTGELVARAQRAGMMRPDVTVADIEMLVCGVSATMAHGGGSYDWQRHLELAIDMLRSPPPAARR